MEFVLGATSAVGAVIFTNPLDVIKTKHQLQGELRAKGQYVVHYKNLLHAGYMVAKEDGLLALQKGLAPAVCFQICLNGTRLGIFSIAEQFGITRKEDGSVSLPRTMLVAAVAGSTGGIIGSPFYLVKTQIQSQAPSTVAQGKNVVLGVQHKHAGSWTALRTIYSQGGIRGLWAGASSAVVRLSVGSCAQLSTFSTTKEFIENHGIFAEDAVWAKAFAACVAVGVVTAVFMSPFDTISTRLYNQKRDSAGRGLMYTGILDCLVKTCRSEGVGGLTKGIFALYFRIAPHTMLNLMFWDKLNSVYHKYLQESSVA